MLLGMQEASDDAVQEFTVYLAEDYLKLNAYTRYVRGYWQNRNGKLEVKPVGLDKSSAVISIKDANCLIVIPPTKTGIKAGEIVKAIPLGGAIFP
ncbi:hypothetical protein O9H85_23140 [Paenibacillus filicis]|uniref:MoeA C-terminal domain-containing protein n=1 Tax=Paenibacillus gyeongsangnamensis TaxID=3388067 RepID=A0ABT4QES0_9BACL|nr:hypothetical protein [Paenibacillus filicis]MCZ8515256.1 hypothetical protein [Paenibacillus filicis]